MGCNSLHQNLVCEFLKQCKISMVKYTKEYKPTSKDSFRLNSELEEELWELELEEAFGGLAIG